MSRGNTLNLERYLTAIVLITVITVLLLATYNIININMRPSQLNLNRALTMVNKAVLSAEFSLGLIKPMNITPTRLQPLSLPRTLYVIGPTSIINTLISAGANPQLLKPIALSGLQSLPNDSMILIDYDYINETMGINAEKLSNILSNLLGRGDLIILYTKSKSYVPLLEDAAAVGWGNYFEKNMRGFKVIGFPVININATSYYIIIYGRPDVLIITPTASNNIYTTNLAIETWQHIVMNNNNPQLNADPTYFDQDPCGILYQEAPSMGLIVIGTGPETFPDLYTGNKYEFDYCIAIPHPNYLPTGTYPTISLDYAGYMNYYSQNNGGNIIIYKAGINLTNGYEIDESNGYNSYMAYVGESSAIQPGNVGCSWFSYSELEIIFNIISETLEFIFEAVTSSDNPVASLTSSLTITPATTYVPSGYLQNIIWEFGIEGYPFCTGASLAANSQYPVGFEIDNGQGMWVLMNGAANTNIAASPVYWSGGLACFPTVLSGNVPGYWNEEFQGVVYFVLEYEPSGSQWNVSLQSINYPEPTGMFTWASAQCGGPAPG